MKSKYSISLKKIAEIVNGKIIGDEEKIIKGTAPFEDATGDDLTFAINFKLLNNIDKTCAGAVIVPNNFTKSKKNLVSVSNPRVAFAKVVDFLSPPCKPGYFSKSDSISSFAHIGEMFVCGKDVIIAPSVVVGDNVSIGDRTAIYPGVVIEDNVKIGNDVTISPNVVILRRCIIGSRVIINAGTVIGSDGFGFAPDGNKYYKIPHKGIVQIDDDVEIGACNTIDRANFGKTHIKKGVKTDNLVHIAHNVVVGENTLLVAQVGIAGSTTIGKHTILAGQAGVVDHITVGNDVIVTAKGGVTKSVPDGKLISGTPAMSHRLWLKVQRILPRLPELKQKIAQIEKRLGKIEKK